MGEEEIIKDTFPPSKLGEYTVVQEIAEGTFGKVMVRDLGPHATFRVLTPFAV